MPKYRVLVTVDCTMSCQVEVEARTPEEAEEEALRLVNDPMSDDGYGWENDDGFASDPYIADPGNCAELAP
jgi:hypothetical protein